MTSEVICNNVIVDGAKTLFSKTANEQVLLSKILNPDILEKILGYLPVKEMLEASLVSFSWHLIIGRSDKCMSKIKVVYKQGYESRRNHNRTVDDDLKSMLDKSIRKYQNLKVSTSDEKIVQLGLTHSWNIIDILENSGREWKEIKVSGINFVCKEEYESFLKAMAPNIKILYLRKVKIVISDDDYVVDVNFPKLIDVDLLFCDSIMMAHTFKNCVNIKRFKYCNGAKLIPFPESFKRILKMNAGLIIFEVTAQDVTHAIFNEKNYALYTCKLRSLLCSNFYSYVVPDFNDSFIKFLRSQSECLREITLTDSSDIETLEVLFNDMKVLEKASITHISQELKVPKFVAMKTNANCPITTITLSGYIPCQSDMLAKTMQACPNLEFFIADLLSEKALDRVTTYCPKIRHMKYRSRYNYDFFKHRFFRSSREIPEGVFFTNEIEKYLSDYD
ncbi:unnamed protein product [Diamesa hyperborea]